MEGILNVTPEKLISTAQEFSASGQTVSSLTQQMTTIVQGMSSSWQGEASTAYINKFNQLQDDIEKLNRMIQEHVTDLNEMARVYQEAESANVEVSSGQPTAALV